MVTDVQSVDKADAMVIGRQRPTDLNARNFQVLTGPFDSNRLDGLQTGATVETVENRQTAGVINVLPSIGNLSDGNGDVKAITRSADKMWCDTDRDRLRSATSIDRHVSGAGQRDRFDSSRRNNRQSTDNSDTYRTVVEGRKLSVGLSIEGGTDGPVAGAAQPCGGPGAVSPRGRSSAVGRACDRVSANDREQGTGQDETGEPNKARWTSARL